MAAIAKDSLSPLLQSATTRRRSLELCQQIKSQLLSPTNLTTLFSPNKKSPSPAKSETSCASHDGSSNVSSRNTSPFKTISDAKALSPTLFFNYELSDGANGTSSDPNYHYKRRASDSLWIDTFPKVGSLVEDVDTSQSRRHSLTPQFADSCQTSFFSETNKEIDQDLESLCSNALTSEREEPNTAEDLTAPESEPVIACNIIPPTPAGKVALPTKDVLHIDFSLKTLTSESDEDDENESDTQMIEKKARQIENNIKFSPDESSFRKCAEKYDLEDSLIKYAALQFNLLLNPEELLGKGSFGTVVAGMYKGEEVAVKVLKTTNVQKKASLMGEANALKLPFHNHIARTIDIFRIEPDKALIVMEKMHKGSLLNLLNDPSFEVSCSSAISFAKQIALALMFCHRQGLLHLDVKPQNILVDLHNCCKLSDFGNSKLNNDLNENYKYSKLEGTVPYTAPELFRGSKPTEKCDVYSFAITMWQILTREAPYENENEHAVIFRVVSQGLRPTQTPDVNNNCRSPTTDDEKVLLKKYCDLYIKAWHSNPEQRPTMADIHKRLIEIQLLKALK